MLYLLSHVTEIKPFNTKRLCREIDLNFLGAFAKLRSVTISFAMSVRPHTTTRLTLEGFS